MEHPRFFLLAFQILFAIFGYGQTSEKKDLDLHVFTDMPKESLFVHYNAGVLFSGETLYYKIYCSNTKTGNLSTLSKMAYVELVGPYNSFIFKHKIKLISGEGQGDFFIPADVPSGNYKLIGYTQWMKNEGTASFFQGDLKVISPFGKNRNSAVKQKMKHVIDSVVKTRVVAKPKIPKRYIKLSIDSSIYKKREKASVTLNSLNGAKGYGNYSLSVRKVKAFKTPPLITALKYHTSSVNNQNIQNKPIYLPELRGELISGKAVSKETDGPVANSHIAISIPGRAYVLDIVKTDAKGWFFFNLDRDYHGKNAIIQVLGNNEKVKIQVDSHSSSNYQNLQFAPFHIDPQMKAVIEQRSVHVQIENAYSAKKRDTIVPVKATYPFFYDENFDSFDLDNYTRFPSIKETFIEVVQNASIKKNVKGASEFAVLPSNAKKNSFSPPLVVVDGILLQNHANIIEFGAKNIKRILVFREKYFYGSKDYQGALVFETLNGDYYEKRSKKNTYSIELLRPRPIKKYFRQNYGSDSNPETVHIPDYRHQLLWKPSIVLDKRKMIVDFFTSDVTGEFEIRLEGFTNDGKPVSLRETIIVE